MASFTAILEVKGNRFPLLGYDLSIHQETDSLGRPASPTLGGTIDCVLSAPGSDQPFLLQWMFSPTMQEDGKIILLQESPRATLKTISFFNAYCAGLQTNFVPGSNGGGSLQMHIRISPQRIAVGAIIHDNNWPLVSHGAGETFAKAASVAPNGEAAKDEKTPGAFMEGLHGVLDVVGMIPMLGEVADAANAAMYLGEGRYGEAALSAAAMVPLAGNVVGAAKIARLGTKLLGNAKAIKALRNIGKAASPKLNKVVDTAFAGIKKCTDVGHPVDVSTGMLFTMATDLNLAGIIPFTWERTWYSASTYQGPLGWGWHQNYDWGLTLEADTDLAIVRMADGRQVAFEAPQTPGQSVFDLRSGLTLHRPLPDAPRPAPWLVYNTADELYYTFAPPATNGTYQPLNSIENKTGQFIGFRYDTSRRLEQITDSAGRILTADYNGQGQLVALYGPHPNQPTERLQLIGYGYDAAGNLVSATDAEGYVTRFVYNDQHQLVQETNATGLSFYFEYEQQPSQLDVPARCVHTWGDGGLFDTKLQYLDAQTTLVWDSYDQQTRYAHHEGLVVSQIDALGNEQRWLYNDDQQLLALTDGLGQTTQYRYDEAGNLISTRYADGTRQDTDYDEENRPVADIDARGNTWHYAYNEQGLLTEQTDPLGGQTRYAYDEQGRLMTVTNAAGGQTQLRYNDQHQLVHIVTPDEQIRSRGYDALGRLTTLTDSNGAMQQRQYDRLGQLTEVVDADGTTRQLTYDAGGNVTRVKEGEQEVELTYTGLGQMAQRRQAGQQVQFGYDREGRLTGITNEAGFQYRFGLNAVGQVIEEEGFDGLLRRYERDAAGRVVRVGRPADRYTTYEYTPTGEIKAVRYSDGTAESFGYDEAGELIWAENQMTTVQLKRDALGRVLHESQGEHWVDYSYDALGQRTGVRSSLGADLVLERDVLGNVNQMVAGNWRAQFGYDSRGLEVQRSLSGGVRVGWQHDAAGRPTQQRITAGGSVSRQRTYQWQAGDRLAQIDDSLTGNSYYEHDVFGALTRAIYSDSSQELRLPDAVGNLYESETKNDRQYGPSGQLMSSAQAQYEYDAEGNLTCKTTSRGDVWRYEWTGNGTLSAALRPDGERVLFMYDALGRRVSKQYKGKTTCWVWEEDKPLHEWTEMSLTGQKTDEVITWLFEEDSFAPIGKLQGQTRQSILTDHLGTPLEMVDQGGQRTWQAETTVYGRIRLEEGTRAACPFRFQGQYEDVETGLYYNRFRYYNPQEGGYISQDPIGLDSNNPTLYGYLREPNKHIDPLGLSGCLPKGKQINRTVHRYSPPDRIATTWDAHKWNVGANHRYTKPGVGGVYGANSAKTAAAEIAHYSIDPSSVQLVRKKVRLKNVLDLTDAKVRKKLGVELDEITGDSYTKSHELGDWAIKNGYDGILAPSARNVTGSNLISFAGF